MVYSLLEPTAALPGTRDKIEVMRKRATAGIPLFHPEDALFSHGVKRLLDEIVVHHIGKSSKLGKVEIVKRVKRS